MGTTAKALFTNAEARTRLKVAFELLSKKGILAKANFWCCQSCGGSAMDLKGYRGGVFWHDQDDERFHKHGSLHIAFLTENGEGALQIGKDLVEALKTVGFDVKWDGTSDERPEINAEPAGRFEERERAEGLEDEDDGDDDGEED